MALSYQVKRLTDAFDTVTLPMAPNVELLVARRECTAILFSMVTHTPLAAITFLSDDGKGDAGMAQHPVGVDAQQNLHLMAFAQLGNKHLTAQLTNLTRTTSLAMDLLVLEGYKPDGSASYKSLPVNEGNVIPANSTYAVETMNHKRIVLEGVCQAVPATGSDPSTLVPVTVAAAAASADAKTGNLQMMLVVAPPTTDAAVLAKFQEGTQWKVLPVACRTCSAPPPVPPRNSFSNYWGRNMGVAVPHGASLDGVHGYDAVLGGGNDDDHWGGGDDGTPYRAMELALGPSLSSSSAPPPSSATRTRSKSMRPRTPRTLESQSPFVSAASDLESCVTTMVGDATPAAAFAGASTVLPQAAGQSHVADLTRIQAGRLAAGESKHESFSSVEFTRALDAVAQRVIFTLGVDAQYHSLPSQWRIPEGTAPVDTQQAWLNQTKAILADPAVCLRPRVFHDEDQKCLIDLESESDTILFPCGHQCVNEANVVQLRACPLCRAVLTGYLKVVPTAAITSSSSSSSSAPAASVPMVTEV